VNDAGLTNSGRHISFQLTAEDIAHANMLHFLRQMRKPKTIIRVATLGFAGVTVAVVIIHLQDWRPLRLLPLFIAYLISVPAILAANLLCMLAFNRRTSRKRFAKHRPMQVPKIVEWTETAFIHSNEFGTLNLPWRDFTKTEENLRYLLIEMTETFVIIPKRCLTEPQLQDLRYCMRAGNSALAK